MRVVGIHTDSVAMMRLDSDSFVILSSGILVGMPVPMAREVPRGVTLYTRPLGGVDRRLLALMTNAVMPDGVAAISMITAFRPRPRAEVCDEKARKSRPCSSGTRPASFPYPEGRLIDSIWAADG